MSTCACARNWTRSSSRWRYDDRRPRPRPRTRPRTRQRRRRAHVRSPAGHERPARSVRARQGHRTPRRAWLLHRRQRAHAGGHLPRARCGCCSSAVAPGAALHARGTGQRRPLPQPHGRRRPVDRRAGHRGLLGPQHLGLRRRSRSASQSRSSPLGAAVVRQGSAATIAMAAFDGVRRPRCRRGGGHRPSAHTRSRPVERPARHDRATPAR